jgi:hypothetical protein
VNANNRRDAETRRTLRGCFSFAAVLLLTVGCSSTPAPIPSGLRVGAAEVDITPPPGLRMSGYFHERLNTGTRDPLKAKAIVLDQGDVRAALVFCDLIGVPAGVALRAREAAEKRTGIPAAFISVAATHSHTGPLYSGPMHKILHDRAVRAHGKDPVAFDYGGFLVEKVAESVARANEALAPSRLESGFVKEPGLAFHRRFHMKDGSVRTNPGMMNPDIVKACGPIDPDVGLLLARGPSGPSALLTVYALHLDTTGGTEYSADYPFALERDLRTTMGPGFVSLFGAGTCGNINHIDVTTKTRRKADEIGTSLAKSVLAEVPRLAPVAPSLAVLNRRVEIPIQKCTVEEVERARLNVDKVGGKELPSLEQVRICTILHLQDLPPVLPLEVQAFRIGTDTAIVTLPGEVFVEFGLAIRKASPFKKTFVVELANDNPAYVPTREAFTQGAYEVVNSRVQPGGGEKLVETAIELLKELKP